MTGVPSLGLHGEVTGYTGPQNLRTIYNFGNLSFHDVEQTFQNISNSFTNYLREHGNENYSASVLGQALRHETCLAVRWVWLMFPSVAVLLTLLFFAAMVFDTRPTGHRAQIWKSSPLALLYHGLERPNVEGVDHLKGMERAAKGMSVRLRSTQTGVKFVETANEFLDMKRGR